LFVKIKKVFQLSSILVFDKDMLFMMYDRVIVIAIDLLDKENRQQIIVHEYCRHLNVHLTIAAALMLLLTNLKLRWLALTFHYVREFATDVFFQSFVKPFVSLSIVISPFVSLRVPSQPASSAVNRVRLVKLQSMIRNHLFLYAIN